MAGCCCGSDEKVNLIYSCSGAANTGLLADQVMRALNKKGVGNSTCMTAMGADLSGFVKSAQEASKNIVLDGCKVSCGRKVFERHGIACEQYIMTNFGVEKGKTPITEELIETVAQQIAERIQI